MSSFQFFEFALRRWHLTPDGEPIITHSSQLLPVRYRGSPAMLKIATEPEEQRGASLMVWWGGEGAARVFEHEGETLLMERIEGGRSLAEMARSGQDDEASRILCATAAQLHLMGERLTTEQGSRPHLVPLERWFEALEPMAQRYGGVLRDCSAVARELLAHPQEVTILHGDLHHGNVLEARGRGWLAIDPKGLIGERGFDFANIFANPDAEMALAPGRLRRQVEIVAEAAGIERERLLRWILAYIGLSASWYLEDGIKSQADLTLADTLVSELMKV